MKTRARGVNDASTRPPGPAAARSLGARSAATGSGARRKGAPVLDVAYAGVVIAVFAVLLLAVRGLDRL